MRAVGAVDDAAWQSPRPRHRKNNFDFLRWCAATLVVLGHSPVLLGKPHFLIWGMPISTFGVLIFFSLSGYLVTESWIGDPRPARFFRKRGLRIFPALFLCVTLSAVLLGPALTTLEPSAYWRNPHTWSYFANGLLKMQYALPGVFVSNPASGVLNGSLWTLPVEFFCYVAICVIGYLGGRQRSRVVLITASMAALTSFAAYYSTFEHDGRLVSVYATDLGAASKVMPYFFVGSALRWWDRRVRFRLDVALMLTLMLTVTHAITLSRVTTILGFVAVPYLVITLGLHRTPVLDRWGKRGDFSYGLYLYAFPIQQTVIRLLGSGMTTIVLFLLSEGVSMGLAVASWHLVESKALTLKPSKRSADTARACG